LKSTKAPTLKSTKAPTCKSEKSSNIFCWGGVESFVWTNTRGFAVRWVELQTGQRAIPGTSLEWHGARSGRVENGVTFIDLIHQSIKALASENSRNL
jgi:hypothetical protein